jgi:hypothetical protein
MDDDRAVADRPLAEQVVLLGLVELAGEGETPVRSYEVKEACVEHLTGRDVGLGELTDREATRSLNRLAADGVVEEVPPDANSAVGKGRPKYEPGVDPEAILDGLADVPAVAAMAERVGERR